MLSGKQNAALRESAFALTLRPNDLAASFEHAEPVYNATRIVEAEPQLLGIVAEAYSAMMLFTNKHDGYSP